MSAELHPWNTSFEWHDHPGPYRVLGAGEARQFDRDGYLVIPDLLGSDLLASVTEELDVLEAEADRMIATHPEGRIGIAESGAITFTLFPVRRSTVMADLSRSPAITGICADLLGPDVNLYWDQAVYKKPEKPRSFPWHQDNGYGFVEPQQYLTVWISLNGASLANGCPWLVPGMHRNGTLAHHFVDPLGWECLHDPEGAVAAPLPAGGAVVFSSLTPHYTGPNCTDEARKSYILQYAPAGAEVLVGDPAKGPATERRPANDRLHQYPVLRNRIPV